jgi:hypothetical protein
MAKGDDANLVRWAEPSITAFVHSALLRYLAVAHFGRGRGEWEEGEHPPAWRTAISAAVEDELPAIRRAVSAAGGPERDGAEMFEQVLTRLARGLLLQFYPEAAHIFESQVSEPQFVPRA